VSLMRRRGADLALTTVLGLLVGGCAELKTPTGEKLSLRGYDSVIIGSVETDPGLSQPMPVLVEHLRSRLRQELSKKSNSFLTLQEAGARGVGLTKSIELHVRLTEAAVHPFAERILHGFSSSAKCIVTVRDPGADVDLGSTEVAISNRNRDTIFDATDVDAEMRRAAMKLAEAIVDVLERAKR